MAEIERVVPSEMVETANKIRAKIEEWNSCVDQLYKLQTELDPMFDGLTNDEYNRQWDEDRAKYNQLSQVMDEYCTAIVTAANKYTEGDESIRNIIRRS